MRRFAILIAALPLVACDGGAGSVNSGPLDIGIVSGNNQVAEAGAERLAEPVVGKLVRQADGGITFRLVTPAYAQGTVVNGSPVAGAVVCAVSVTGAMEAFTPCTNTESDGTATFFFEPGTKAGAASSEIRGTVAGEPAVFDTASATVVAGAMDPSKGIGNLGAFPLDADGFQLCDREGFRDEYDNRIACTETVTGDAATIRMGDSLGGSLDQQFIVRADGAVAGDQSTIEFYRDSDDSLIETWVVTLEATGRATVQHQ